MKLGVPSRFACLKIEDDDPPSVQGSKPKETKKKAGKHPHNGAAKNNNKSGAAKNNPNQGAENGPESAKSKKAKKLEAIQWEEWKERDEQMGYNIFEDDLRRAIMLSKLEYERDNAPIAENTKRERKKKFKKGVTYSLGAFLNGDDVQSNSQDNDFGAYKCNCANNTISLNNAKQNVDFFTSVERDTQIELKKEIIGSKLKEREANISEIMSAQSNKKYEMEHKLRLAKEKEIEELKAALEASNGRFTNFYEKVTQDQGQSNAAMMHDYEMLTNVKNDLTDSVANLHVLLEKERTKVSSLTAALNSCDKHKPKSHKKR